MQQSMVIPKPPLSEFVALLWSQENYTPQHHRELALPDGSVELIINLHEDRLPVFARMNPGAFSESSGSLIYGPHSEYFVIDTSRPMSIIGVHFKPGGAFPFLGLPADELQNQVVTLDTFWGLEVNRLREKLLAARTMPERYFILEQTLLRQTRLPLERHPAVTFALKHFHRTPYAPVGDVTGQIGLSQKRFIDVFRQAVGLTPKLFCRIRRFQQVMHHLNDAPNIDWIDVALACGYFDQAHFIHDFRTFSGLNPVKFIAQRSERPGHPAVE